MTRIRVRIEQIIEVDELDFLDERGHPHSPAYIADVLKNRAEADPMEFCNVTDLKIEAEAM